MRIAWLLGMIALIGSVNFAVLEAVQTILRSDRPFSDPMSTYVTGPHGWVQTMAFAALALGSAALCIGLGSTPQSSSRWHNARGLVGVWALGVSLAAVFPFDPDASGSATSTVHSAASLVSFVAVLAAMFVFASASRTVPLWSSLSRLSAALTYVAAASLAIASATQGSLIFGVAQRTFLGAVVVWLAVAGVHLSRAAMPGVKIDSLRQAFEAFNRGDESRLEDLLDPQVEWHGIAGVGVEPCQDRNDVVANLRNHVKAGFQLEILELIPTGANLVVGFRPAPTAPVPAGSRIYTVFRVRAGKVIHIQGYDRVDEALADAGSL
jgi:hypothetical protein